MFVELMPLLAGRTVLITVAKVDDKTIRGAAGSVASWLVGGFRTRLAQSGLDFASIYRVTDHGVRHLRGEKRHPLKTRGARSIASQSDPSQNLAVTAAASRPARLVQ